MEQQNKSRNDNLKNALCYIPLVAFVLFFVEENKTVVLKKHIKYGVILLIGYVILQAVLGWLLSGLLFLLYGIISVFLFYKAYNGEDMNIEQIDDLEKKVRDEFSSSKK